MNILLDIKGELIAFTLKEFSKLHQDIHDASNEAKLNADNETNTLHNTKDAYEIK